MAVPTTTETTSTARYRVVALATTLAMVTYLDRTAIGTLAPGIRRDLGLSAVEMGWIFTAFQLAYGLFEIPTGRVAERGADVLALNSAARARSGPRDLLLRRASGRRIDTRLHRQRRPPGAVARPAEGDVVARRVRDLRLRRPGVGGDLALLVPQRPVRAPVRQRVGAGCDRRQPEAGRWSTPRSRCSPRRKRQSRRLPWNDVES